MTDEMLVAELRALGDWVYGDLLAAAADRLSSLEEEKRVRSWQPIETAPKDGNEFLAYCPEMSLFQVVDYDPSEDHPDWVWAVSDGVKYHKTAFTHWMPLPEPPVLSAGVGPLHTPMMENR